MKYASLFSAALFTSIVLSPLAQAQERAASPLLPKIFATFRAADLNRDGDLSQEERNAVGLPKEDGKAFDLDSDGLWCEGEFVLYYRRLLKRNGKKIDRALELEAGRINRAYKDAADRGLNRDAAQRAADAVRAGTLEAAQEAAQEAANLGGDADEPFLPERVEIEPEPAELPVEVSVSPPEGGVGEPAEELPQDLPEQGLGEESVLEPESFEQPVAVPPPFDIPTWAPAPLSEDSNTENDTENTGAAMSPTQEGPAAIPVDVETNSESEEEPTFVVPEFSRPDFVLPEVPVVPAVSEETGNEGELWSGATSETSAIPAPEPTPQETTPLEPEDGPAPEPSSLNPSKESTSYDVFGEPTLDVPQEEIEQSAGDPEIATEEELETSPAPSDVAATPVQPEEAKPAEVDRPLTDQELDELRQEEDAQAARDRYGFPETEEFPTEEPTAAAQERAEPAKKESKLPPGVKRSPSAETTPKGAESATPDTPEAQSPASKEAAKPAPEKPLSLWERAERARKLREQREQEAQKAQEKPSESSSEKTSTASDEGESEGPF